MSPLILVPDGVLRSLSEQSTFANYLSRIWKLRFYIVADARGKAFSAGKGTFLGRLWIILDPLLQVALYAFVFGLILNVSRGIDNFIGFLIIGVIFFRIATLGATSGIGLVRKTNSIASLMNAPRAIGVFSVNIKNFLDQLFPAVIAVLVTCAFQVDALPGWSLLAVPLLYLLLWAFTAGSTFVVARITAFIPDFKSVVTIVNRGLFFISGVFFDLSRFDTYPELQRLMEINPIYQFLSALRVSVLDGRWPEINVWVYLIVWGVGLLVFGFIFFWAGEGRYATVR